MRSGHRVMVVGVLSLLLLLGSVLPAGAATSASASGVALKLHDLPAGFKQIVSQFVSTVAFAKSFHVSVSTVRRKGWIAGYESKFVRTTTRGITYIDDEVAAFKTSSGARWAYNLSLTTTGTGRRVSIGHLGDQSSAYAYFSKSTRGTPITVYAFIFRHGVYVAVLFGGGITGRFKKSDVLHYAQVIDSRM